MKEEINALQELHKDMLPMIKSYQFVFEDSKESRSLRNLEVYVKESVEVLKETKVPQVQKLCIDQALGYLTDIEEIINGKS